MMKLAYLSAVALLAMSSAAAAQDSVSRNALGKLQRKRIVAYFG